MRKSEREVKDLQKIREIIEDCKVCRLGLCDGEDVYIVPVNFGYELEDEKLTIYVHGSREGRKIDMMNKNARVCIEMDCQHGLVEGESACQYSYHYASIIGNGKGMIMEESEEKQKALDRIMRHQTGKEFSEFAVNPKLAESVAILKIGLDTYTCKQH